MADPAENKFSEEWLEALKAQARVTGQVTGQGVAARGGPHLPGPAARNGPPPPGYYGLPVIKPPVWTWEIPAYFFAGGIAGMSAVIALGAILFGHLPLARWAMWIALAGAILSTALLVKDLGRPSRFLNMLRIFKPQSPMSVGSWVLTFFGAIAFAGALLTEWSYQLVMGDGAPGAVGWAAGLFIALAALFGAMVSTYTGVLIAATAVPAWFSHRTVLPIHFGITALGSAGAVLELSGFLLPALHAIGILAAASETILAGMVEFKGKGTADRALREGASGWMMRGAGLLAGPLALFLRILGWIPVAAAVFLAGALLNRYAWMQAGRISAKDPEAVFASQR